MTKSEYTSQYRQARKNYPLILRQTMTQVRKAYKKAADAAAAEVARAQLAGLSDLTQISWASIDDQLRRSIRELNDVIDSGARSAVLRGSEATGKINRQYLTDALRTAGADSSIIAGTREMYRAINEDVVRNMLGRIYRDGYTYSERIWRTANRFQDDIKGVISAGIAQGRPVEKIARDIQVYARDGRIALVNRYGRLERGTREFTRRIGNRVDYRALRLVRTELYTSVREASREQGHSNPGCKDEFDWVLEAGRQQWDCECPSLAAGSPYKYNDVPQTPHSSCSCDLRPILRDSDEFISDLKTWVNGGEVGYIDNWYRESYVPRQVA